MLSIVCALIAATIFALGTVLQQRVAMTADDAQARSPWFMLRLARYPVWWTGIVLTWVGFAFHATALSAGEIVVVQPILALTVVFALPIGARLSAQRIERRDVAGAVVATAGLAAFLILGNPSAGIELPSGGAWLLWGGACFALAALLTAAGLDRRAAGKATLCGIAAGVLFGLHGAVTKAMTERLDMGVDALLASWAIWGVLLVALISMAISQIALQAGDLPPAIATESIVTPVVSGALGLGLYQESLHETTGGAVVSLLAFAAMLAGVAFLARREGERLEGG